MLVNNRNLSKRKVINTGIALSILSILYILFFFPSANAASIKDTVNEMVDFINSGASENIYSLFADTYTNSALSFGTEFMTFLQGLASVVAIVIMVGKLEESLARGRGDTEALSEGVIALVICLLVVLYANDILNIINGIGNLIVEAMSTKVSSGVDTGLNTDTYSQATGTLDAIGLLIKVFLVYLLAKIEVIAVKMVAFSIILELGIRRIFFPLAVVDIYGEGMRSSGMRYMKKYLACWVRMAICIAVAYLGNLLITTVSDSATVGAAVDTSANQIAIAYTTIAVMLKGQDVANDIVGV